ncbi:MAG TPA: lyase family protein, partial [Arenibaculum sp.]|nr:lyase family protein [Arenibaculum sp.]
MLLEPQFRTPATDDIWSPPARLRRMLDFEAALAEVQAELGLIPVDAAGTIARVCAQAALDPDKVFGGAAMAGNPAIVFAGHLTRLVGEVDAAASSWVHYGATSQDLIDTATMLGLRDTVEAVLDDAAALADALAALAGLHAETPLAGRTLLQQATPVTFGVKAALWATAVD